MAAHENIYAITDCLGICKFVCHGFNSPKLLKYEHFSQLLEKAVGVTLTVDRLREIGSNVVDLERAFLNREGVRRRDDMLPFRYFETPMKQGVAKGHRIEKDKFLEMLERYYRLRGWDQTGMVPRDRVLDLVSSWKGE